MDYSRRKLLLALVLGVVLAGAGCEGREGGHSRGMFTGYVMDKTDAEVIERLGKPDAIEAANPNTPKWTYKRKTFDPDNMNKVDPEVILILQKDASGKLKVIQVIFG